MKNINDIKGLLTRRIVIVLFITAAALPIIVMIIGESIWEAVMYIKCEIFRVSGCVVRSWRD